MNIITGYSKKCDTDRLFWEEYNPFSDLNILDCIYVSLKV